MTYRSLLFLVPASLVACASFAAADEVASVSPRFDINKFDVRGNTLLPAHELEHSLAAFVGGERDFGDVVKAQEALEAAYHRRGYQLVRVNLPEQELNGGVVVFQVVEARIGQVRIAGNQHFSNDNVRYALPGLKEGQTPDLTAISKSLKLANENPAKQTVMKLKDSDAQEAAVDAELQVTDESPWSASLNMDNSGTRETGKTYMGAVLQNANLFGRDQVMSLQYTTTLEKPERVSVYGLGYHLPLYELGDSLDVFTSYSDVDNGLVTAGIFDLAVSGKGTIFGGRYNHNLATDGNYQSKLVYGIDYKAYKNNLEAEDVQLGNDITVHPLSLGYQGTWVQLDGDANFGVTLVHNLPGGSRGRQSDFDLARTNARDDYNALRLAANITQALPADWQLRGVLNGQYSNDALIPGEQFGAGGAMSVRGFREREVSNDSGISSNLEAYTPPICGGGSWQCRALAFYDNAYLTRNHALPGEFTHVALSSTGLGMRVSYRRNLNLQVDYGHVLHAEASETERGDNRLHARLSLSF
ncbi:ShlB/FhaC/HecB family hemolysin secretion/activation protein [Pseudomonas syringae]|uniref:Peptidase S37 n=1 Tax=Pseudomonas syringae TaxID=317 RepID=A0A085VG85_PSESX|nr:ShlB/FhaC/HecB family hemolysin secretion/activation protein [Pseudomonas syringae]KFE54448.1 peptidase S37 [Pseudomonas syringae]